jgi:hypothetical protein
LRFVVIGILLAFLAGAIYVGHYGWVSAGDVPMPPWGWLMMGLGIFFTLVIGGSLMILIFYSSRAGYDEAPQIEYDDGSDAETVAPKSEPPAGSARRPEKQKHRRQEKRWRDKAAFTPRLHALNALSTLVRVGMNRLVQPALQSQTMGSTRAGRRRRSRDRPNRPDDTHNGASRGNDRSVRSVTLRGRASRHHRASASCPDRCRPDA